MSPRCWEDSSSEKGLLFEEALSGTCPRTPLKSLPCLTAKSPLVCELCTRGSVLPHISQVGDARLRDLQELKWQGWRRKEPDCITLHPFASRVGFSSEGVGAFLRSSPLRVSPCCPGSSRTDRLKTRSRIGWLFSKRAGEFSLHRPQGAGLGEEIDLHLISCK